MGWTNTRDRYGAGAMWLHWLVAVLVLVLYALGMAGDVVPRGATRQIVRTLHESVGLLLIALVAVRIVWRLLSPPPPPLPETMSPLARVGAHAAHWALYGLVVAAPLSGLVAAWLDGRTPAIFGFGPPALLAPDRTLVHTLEEVHEVLANLLLWLAAAHAAVGLWHHVIRRDDILLRMLPRRRS